MVAHSEVGVIDHVGLTKQLRLSVAPHHRVEEPNQH